MLKEKIKDLLSVIYLRNQEREKDKSKYVVEILTDIYSIDKFF